MCVVATIDSIRHTLDAPALEYVPAVQEVHVADELAPVALEYVPATQSVHSEAPSDRQPGHLVIVRYKRMRTVAYTRCIALFVLLRAQHCLAVRYDGYL